MCRVKTYPGTTSTAEETVHLQGLMEGGRIQRTGNGTSWGGRGAGAGAGAAACAVCWPVEPGAGSVHSFLQDLSDVKWAIQRLDC